MTEPRTRHVLRHRAALGAALFGVLLGGVSCTGSSGDLPSRINGVVLQLSDFPPSWRAYPQPTDAPDILGETASCTGDAKGGKSVTTVRSSEFRHGDQHITSTGIGYASTIAVSDRADALGSKKAEDCVAPAMRAQVLSVLPGATIKSTSLTVKQGGINVAVNYAGAVSGTMKVDLAGKPATVYVDTVFLLSTDFYVNLNFVSVGKRVSDFIQTVLTNKIAVREQHLT